MKACPDDVLLVLASFERKGFRAYLVGGSVRDLFLGLPPFDFDVTTDAPPEAIPEVFPEARRVGPVDTPVFILPNRTASVEITSHCGRSLADDLSRRDFTVNAMALDIRGTLHDPQNGSRDCALRVLRFCGEPSGRIREDPVRILRFARFSAVLPGFSPSPEGFIPCRSACRELARIAPERLTAEIRKAVMGDPVVFLDLLDETGALGSIFPEVASLRGEAQDPAVHPEGDAYAHTRNCLSITRSLPCDTRLRLAVLLHDIGKPCSRSVNDGIVRFPGHEEAGALMAEGILQRLRFPAKEAREIVALVRSHGILLEDAPAENIAELFCEHGADWLDLLFLTGWCDMLGAGGVREAWIANRRKALGIGIRASRERDVLPSGAALGELTGEEAGPAWGRAHRRLRVRYLADEAPDDVFRQERDKQ